MTPVNRLGAVEQLRERQEHEARTLASMISSKILGRAGL